jgi:hypothetical protein
MSTVRRPQPLGLEPSFGFGDRLGLATPGHIDAVRAYGGPILPIFAQQSIREMQRTGRRPSDVMADAVAAVKAGTFTGKWGADADHLKTQADANDTAGAGFVFFTLDPSQYVDQQADDYDAPTLKQKFQRLQQQVTWVNQYRNRTVKLDSGSEIVFDAATVQRAAVKYGRAVDHAIKLAEHIESVMAKREQAYEIELSVDETEQPTTAAEHFIIAEQCLKADMKLLSLAPRYVGDFEKGIDYKGNIQTLRRSLDDHAAIARQLGPYKLSLHSGSDKLSMYEIFAHCTRGMFHVKTAGTSYLEALRVVVRHDAGLMRRIIDFARDRFDTDKATYHISARLANVPPQSEISDAAELEGVYLNEDDGRQILHVTFGSVLTDATLGPALTELLVAEPETHRDVLREHFGTHLKALCRGM